jgi:UDPglucose--hexose-1-phosphate uridylyltransferase
MFHQGSFGDLANEEIDDLAGILIRILSAVRLACGDPDFNLVMYSAPSNGGHHERVFHWHLKLIPKLSTPAGFEIGSAMSINTMPPEEAAARLRAALRGSAPA